MTNFIFGAIIFVLGFIFGILFTWVIAAIMVAGDSEE